MNATSTTPTMQAQVAQLVSELSHHVGRANGIRMEDLALRLCMADRHVRDLVALAREDGIAICAMPETGYFIAATVDELESCCQFLRSRAMHSLMLESRLRKIPLADLVGQLHIPT